MTFDVPEDAKGQRLDRWLTEALPERSRSWVTRAVEDRRVTVSGAVASKPGLVLRGGESIAIAPSAEDDIGSAPLGEDIPLTVVYQDEHLAVIDKPSGLVVHPAAGHRSGTLVNALLHWARSEDIELDIDDEVRPGIVHRIDKDTSGLLVVAFDDQALRGLQAKFQAHDIERLYRAVVHGTRLDDEGTRTSDLGRHRHDRKKFASLPVGVGVGKHAVTHWRTLQRGRALALVECRLETGRTHQIRVHLSEMGYPIVSDPIYGNDNKRSRRDNRTTAIAMEEGAARAMPRLALHAAVLGFEHPVTGQALRFESPDPADFATLVRAIG